MRILMVVEAWFPHTGGGQVHAWELSKALVKKGHDVVIVTRNNGRWDESYPGVRVVRLGHFKKFSNILGRLEFLFLAYSKVLFTKADLIHLHAFSPGLLAPFLKIKGKPVIFTVHGEGFKIAGLPFKFEFLQNLVFYKTKYDGEISVAKQTLTQKCATKKVWVIPNGVNIEDWRSAQRDRDKVKHLVYVGRLVYDKGVDLLIEAFKKLDNKNLDLTIIGEGSEMEKLKQLAKGEKIKFLGKLEGKSLTRVLKRADLYVMPSRVEGMPIRLLEAWASKIPVLATKVGDNGKFIKDGKNGFLSDVDEFSIKKSIEKILRTKKLKTISNSAFIEVEKYCWDKIADQTLDKYKKVLRTQKNLGRYLRIDWRIWVAAIFFVAYRFWLITLSWSGRNIAPEPDDSYIYIQLIRVLVNHGFLGQVAGISHYTLGDVMYIGYTGPLAIISKITGLSPENVFHLFFYLGTIILVSVLGWILRRLTNNKFLIAYALVIMALYNGSGNYHGFYWVVPSFVSVMLYFALFGLIFWESKNWYFWAVLISFLFVTSHPISVFATLIFVIWYAIYSLLSWKIDLQLLKKVGSVFLFSVAEYLLLMWFYASKGVEITGEFSYYGAIRAVGYFTDYIRVFLSGILAKNPNGPVGHAIKLSPNMSSTISLVQTGNWDVIRSDYINILFPNPLLWITFLFLLYFIFLRRELRVLSLYLANSVFVVVSTWAWVGFRSLSFLWPTTFLTIAFGSFFIFEFLWKNMDKKFKLVCLTIVGMGVFLFILINVVVGYVWAEDLNKNNNLTLDRSCVDFLLDNTNTYSKVNYANKTAYSVFKGLGMNARGSNFDPKLQKSGEFVVVAKTHFDYYQPSNPLVKMLLLKTSRRSHRNSVMDNPKFNAMGLLVRNCGDFTINKVVK